MRFQSTLPRGERLCLFERVRRAHKVSIHAPAWGATILWCVWLGLEMFQSTLPRGERLGISRQFVSLSWVSIHAPAWGATRGYTRPYWYLVCFNPRSRVGSDELSAAITPVDPPVSIHAPAWGATVERRHGCRVDICFNPRSRVGSDVNVALNRAR